MHGQLIDARVPDVVGGKHGAGSDRWCLLEGERGQAEHHSGMNEDWVVR